MPPKVNPNDWERLFGERAPRRGGPFRALFNLLIVGLLLSLIGVAVVLGTRTLNEARASTSATRAAQATSAVFIDATNTAKAIAAQTATSAAVVIVTPTAEPTPTPWIGSGSVLNGGNLRSEPIIVGETVIGQICPGDRLDFLEERIVAETGVWYRIRVIETAADCTAQRVTVGSSGWASATLLSEPER